MKDLSSCEILDELKKIGINTPFEMMEYLEDYSEYSLDNFGPASSEDRSN